MTIADMRARWIGGDVEPAWRVTVAKQAFDFSTVRRQYVTVDGQSWLDDFSDSGGRRVMWGGSAQANDGRILRLWNRSAWGEASAWRYALDDGDALSSGSSVVMRAGSRCGAHNRAAGGWWVYNVNASNQLQRHPVTLSGTNLVWGAASNPFTVPTLGIAPTNVVVCPVSEDDCFVVGFNAPVLWACLLRYQAGAWSNGKVTPLVERADLTWIDALQASAARLGATDVLAIPTGADGRHMIVRHTFDNSNITSDIYHTPEYILASPQEDMGRRVWVQGLNVIDGRLWATVWNELEGDSDRFYAGHLALASSADGSAWTDEGFVTQQDIRGKLYAVNSDLWIASSTGVLSMPKNARFSGAPSDASWQATGVSELHVSNGGQRQTTEMRIVAGTGWQAAVQPGMRVIYELGAYTAPGVAEYAQQFTGFIDSPTLSQSIGVAREEWLARGALSRLIGETAYRPATSLWLMGRQAFRTNFLVNGIAAQSLAAMNGYWVVDKDTTGRARLRCTGSGISIIPTLWQTPELTMLVRAKSAGSFGVILWNASDDAEVANEYYALELITGSLRVIKAKGYGATRTQDVLYSMNVGAYTQGTEFALAVRTRAGILHASLALPGGTTYGFDAASVASVPLNPLGSAPKHVWRAGVLAQLPQPTFSGSGANDAKITVPAQADGEKTQLEPRTYRIQITRTGATDAFQWGYLNGSTWVWKETARDITGFTQNLENNISVSFTAKSGHALNAYWEFQYPQPEAQVYEVTAVGGGAPLTIQDALSTVAGQAGVPIEFDAPVNYTSAGSAFPFVDDFDVSVRVNGYGEFLRVFDEAHAISISSFGLAFAGNTQMLPAFSFPLTLRVVYADRVLSVHYGGKPQAVWRVDFATPNGKLIPQGSAVLTTRPLGIPIEEVMWDYNQPGSSVLESVLNRRRIYIFEDPDGVVRITRNRERGWSISPTYPVGGYTAYERAISGLMMQQDARGLLGLVQIIGDGSAGSRVALLEPRTLQYGARSTTIDTPWVRTESAALEEARRVLLDARRELSVHELTGFWDPTLKAGQQFYGPEGWSGIVEAYEHQLTIQQDRIGHVARISASATLTLTPNGKWVKSNLYPNEPSAALYPNPGDYPGNNNMPFGPTIAQPPQTTVGKTRWNKFSWK